MSVPQIMTSFIVVKISVNFGSSKIWRYRLLDLLFRQKALAPSLIWEDCTAVQLKKRGKALGIRLTRNFKKEAYSPMGSFHFFNDLCQQYKIKIPHMYIPRMKMFVV